MSRDPESILVLTTTAPVLPPAYRLAADPLELETALRATDTDYALVLVFTDFPLTAEHALRLGKGLPFLVVDVDEQRSVDTLGAGFEQLFNQISFFDRVAVRTDARWEQVSVRFKLTSVNREPWPDGERGRFFNLEGRVVDFARLTGPDTEEVQVTRQLRDRKLTHLAEKAVVGGFIEELVEQNNGSTFRLIEYGSDGGAWCTSIGAQVDYVGLIEEGTSSDKDGLLLTQMKDQFPHAEFRPISDARQNLHADAIFCCDRLNDGSAAGVARLRAMLELAADGTRFLHLENFTARPGAEAGATIKDFEERLWEASDGRVLLERCEIILYPHDPATRTRALIQTRWMGS
jgi:hypothetical protein